MRGLSAKSLVGVLAAVEAAKGDAYVVGNELFDVVGILDMSPQLRRILADPAIEAQAQDGLARSVFGDKISEGALSTVIAAASARWSSGRDMSDALETAGVLAHVIAADKAGSLDTLEDQLFGFGQVVDSDPELRRVITDRTIDAGSKNTLIGRLLDGKVSASVEALAKQAATARTGSFEKRLATFTELAATRRNRILAVVRVAYELGDAEKARLTSALTAKYGRDVHINIIVDTDVVGGISVAVGDQIVDGTVSSRLEDARRRIAG